MGLALLIQRKIDVKVAKRSLSVPVCYDVSSDGNCVPQTEHQRAFELGTQQRSAPSDLDTELQVSCNFMPALMEQPWYKLKQ